MNAKTFYNKYNYEIIEDKESFNKLVSDFKKVIKSAIEKGDEIFGFTPNHYTTSGFVKRGDKCVYISIFDVRNHDNWINAILIRKCKNEKDFVGEHNNFVSILDLPERINELLKY